MTANILIIGDRLVITIRTSVLCGKNAYLFQGCSKIDLH